MKKKHLKEIERITKLIPKELTDNLTKKVPVMPVTKEIIVKALSDAKLERIEVKKYFKWYNPFTWFAEKEYKDVWKVDGKIFDKKKYQMLVDSGELDREVEVVDEEVEKKIDNFLNIEFDKSRKLGYLPPLPKLKEKSKKLYVKNFKKGKKGNK